MTDRPAIDSVITIDGWMVEAHATAVEKGWWDTADGIAVDVGGRNIGEQLALFHSEISEALEEWREGHPLNEVRYRFKQRPDKPYAPAMRSDKGGSDKVEVEVTPGNWIELTVDNAAQLGFDAKPLGFGIELADILIRVFDTAEAYGIDLQQALEIKAAYNRGRPYRHGGKLA